MIILVFFSQLSLAVDWVFLTKVKASKDSHKLISFINNNSIYSIQLKKNNDIFSIQKSINILGSNEYILLEPNANQVEYNIFVKPVYKTGFNFNVDFKLDTLKETEIIEYYNLLYHLSIKLYKNGSSDFIKGLDDYFSQKPNRLIEFNEITRRYCWSLFETENYQKLFNTLIKIEHMSRENSFYVEFMWLKGLSEMNLGNYNNASKFFDRALQEYNNRNQHDRNSQSIKAEISALYGFSIALNSFFNKQSSINAERIILQSFHDLTNTTDYQLKERILYLLASYETLNKNYIQSLTYLELAKINIEKSLSTDGLFKIYNQIAVNYTFTNELSKALKFYRLSLVNINPNSQEYSKAVLQHNLANTYQSIGDYYRAYRYYEKSLSIYTKLNLSREKALILISLGEIDRIRGDYKKAMEKHKISTKYFKKKSLKQYLKSLHELSQDYYHLNKSELAISTALELISFENKTQLSLEMFKTNLLSEFKSAFAKFTIFDENEIKSILFLAKVLHKQNKIKKLNYLLVLLESSFNSVDTFINVKIEYFNFLIQILQNQKKFIKLEYEANRIFNFIYKERSELNVSDLALHWTHKAKSILNIYINSLIDQKKHHDVFKILEKYYAINLREKRYDTTNQIIKQKSKEIQKALDSYVKLERETLLSSNNDIQNKADEAKEHFLALKDDDKQDVKKIKLNYLSIEQVQVKLDEKELFLRYYINDTHAFVFIIDKDSYTVKQLSGKSKLHKTIKSIIDNIKSKRFNNLTAQDDIFAQILPRDKINSGLYDKIIIIPDGILNLLPFASINISPDNGEYIPLVTKINIERTYSASDYFAQIDVDKNNDTISIFANPVYLQNSNDNKIKTSIAKDNKLWEFTPLPYTQQEAQNIQQNFPNTSINLMSGANATNENFLSDLTRNSNIIHIATHGFFNDKNLENVGIATSIIDADNKQAPGVLAMREILYQPFKANLAVISGCETTLGKEINGEGFNSLSRGLLSQGVGSVIGTIWSISDRATPVFMNEFYSNLKKTNGNVAKALNQSKANFATQARFRRYRHPYYWAGFVLTSSNKGISEGIFD